MLIQPLKRLDLEILAVAKPFEFALVGQFRIRHPALDNIRNFFLFAQTFRHVLIKLSNDLDYSRIFSRSACL
ncbi:hypothetical protein IEQ34_011695 [Dendrobium chrysotoxum]|uniref:Uncharacterized protein n=1 Tax=Dendrobium chrysotoxum TaxID=161865 RepID=A0AAV7GQH9_DENCH|nr:hypothetical protein IEQ34_011695 [Dendrobium chrysotoxum]